MLRKFLIFFVTPLVTILLIVVRIPEIESFLKSLDTRAPYFVYGFLVLATVFSYYVTVFSPYIDFEKLAKSKWKLLDERAQQLIKKYCSNGQIPLSIYILTPELCFLRKIEPYVTDKNKVKISAWIRVFRPIWHYGDVGINSKLKISVSQGVSGLAYEDGSIYAAVLSKDKDRDFNFSINQKKVTDNIAIIVSCPITIKENGIYRQKIKRIGVMNIESPDPKAEALLNDPDIRGDLYQDLAALTLVYKNLI